MFKIDGDFERFDEVTLHDLIGAIGVYVIWDSRSTKKPRYIGQGYLMDRLSNHNDNFYPPLHGYVAILGYDDKNRDIYKHRAELLEAALLLVADETGRLAKANRQPARTGLMDKLFEDHGVIKIKLNGYDPFRHVNYSDFISENKKIICIRAKGKTEFEIEHNWRWLRGA